MEQIKAGHVTNAKLVNWPTCVVLTGRLDVDLRNRFARNSPVRTSWIEEVRYVESEDTSYVYTRNSVYTCTGNILKGISEGHTVSGNQIKYDMDIQAHIEKTNALVKEAEDENSQYK